MKKNNSPLEINKNGEVTWSHQHGDLYVVTGVDRNGKRLKARTFNSWLHARCINLYRGNKWLLRDGRRYRIQSVWN